MTLRELNKWITQQQHQDQQLDNPELEELIGKLRGRRFFDWVPVHYSKVAANGKDCCFNHIIGLPTKGGVKHNLYDYEREVFRALEQASYLNSDPSIVSIENSTKYSDKVKHAAVLKASGLGISELILRFIAWLCLKDDKLKGSQIIIFTGPRLELAVSLITRLKELFKPHGITFTDKETVFNLNGVRIEAFPSHHADSARGLPNVSLIFADECSFFPDKEKDNVMDIMLRNVPKSNPYLIAVSTPNKPGDLMDLIMQEPVETSPFKKLWLDYSYGINKIYTNEEINKIKNSRSFEREFNLKFAGIEGNVFSYDSIENAQKISYDPDQVIPAKLSIGIDPSFGSSSFGIVVTRFVNEKIQVCIAEEHSHPSFSSMLDRIWEIKKQHGFTAIYCDAANPSIWQDLKREFGERYDSKYVFSTIAEYDKKGWDINSIMRIIPVPFSVNHAKMLQHTKSLLEDPHNLIAIHPRFDKLITSLRTAVAEEYKLKKEDTSYNDILDAFRLSLQFYKRRN